MNARDAHAVYAWAWAWAWASSRLWSRQKGTKGRLTRRIMEYKSFTNSMDYAGQSHKLGARLPCGLTC